MVLLLTKNIKDKTMEIMLVIPDKQMHSKLVSLIKNYYSGGPVHFSWFSNGIDAAGYMKEHIPEIVFVSSDLPDMDGVRLISQHKIEIPNTRFVLIIKCDDDINGKLTKHAIYREIQDCIYYPYRVNEVMFQLLSLSPHETAERELARSIRSLRNTFMDRFIESDSFAYQALDVINRQYHINLTNGLFQIVIINFSNPGANENLKKSLLSNIVEDARLLLDPQCFEMIPFVRDLRSIVLVLNYSTSKNIREYVEKLYDVVCINMEKHDFKIPFCIGVGHTENDSIYMKKAFQTAENALRCQLLYGSDQIFFIDDHSFEGWSLDTAVIHDLMNNLMKQVEALDPQGTSYAVHRIMSQLGELPDPAYVSDICNMTGLAVFTTLKKTCDMPDPKDVMELIHRYLNNDTSMEDLKRDMAGWAEQLVEDCRDKKQNELSRPISEARKYIDNNYNKPLTLQNVSEKIHMSPGYFCTVFRDETGYSFSDYITHLRIEKSKELLIQTDNSILEISETVGYSNPKYFSRIFLKVAGMQPSGYRKLHKNKISER